VSRTSATEVRFHVPGDSEELLTPVPFRDQVATSFVPLGGRVEAKVVQEHRVLHVPNLAEEGTISIDAGDTVNFAGFEVTYEQAFSRQEPGRFVNGAVISVTEDGAEVGTYEPRLNNYSNNTSAIATPAVDTMPSGDLYLSLRSITPETVVLEMFWFPFIWLIWVGGFLAGAAGIWAYAAKKPERVEVREGSGV
jgi:cytochrome c biogenesis factor